MTKFLLTAILMMGVFSSVCEAAGLSDAECKQLNGLLQRRSIEKLGAPRSDSQGFRGVVQKNELLDGRNCHVVKGRHDSHAHGTFVRVVCD